MIGGNVFVPSEILGASSVLGDQASSLLSTVALTLGIFTVISFVITRLLKRFI